MQPISIFFLLLLGSLPLYSQNGYWQTGAGERGFANATAAYINGNIMSHNVGALGFVKNSYISAGYDYRSFVEGLNNINLQSVQYGKKRSYGLSLFKSGDKILNEFAASVGVGQKLGIASLGIKASYYQIYSEAFGFQRAYSISAGGVAEFYPNFRWGAYIENLAQLNNADIALDLPIAIASGFTYHISDNLMIAGTGALEMDKPLRISTGFDYQIIPAIAIRAGVDWYHKHMHYGVGFNLKKIIIDYAFTPIVPIGNMHSLTLHLNYGRK